MIINQISPNINTANNKFKKQNVAFTSEEPKSKLFVPIAKQYDKFTDSIARGLAKVVDTKTTAKIINYTKDSAHFKNNYVSHLATLGSVILSGFYVTKTLHNEKLDENKRRTLAINQGIVWGISTIMGYTFNKLMDKKVSAFVSKFKEFNKDLTEKELSKYENGIKVAKSLMIFDIVYRFVAPVIVTPIANHIGNKVQEKKELELKGKANA